MSALSRIRSHPENKQADVSFKTAVLANSRYCPLIWIFSSKVANNEITRTHKRAFRILYKNNNLSFDKCLMTEVDLKIYIKNLQKVMRDVFKTQNY